MIYVELPAADMPNLFKYCPSGKTLTENPNWSRGSSHSLCFIVFPFTQQAQILCIWFSFDSFELSLLMTDFHIINLKIDFIF